MSNDLRARLDAIDPAGFREHLIGTAPSKLGRPKFDPVYPLPDHVELMRPWWEQQYDRAAIRSALEAMESVGAFAALNPAKGVALSLASAAFSKAAESAKEVLTFGRAMPMARHSQHDERRHHRHGHWEVEVCDDDA